MLSKESKIRVLENFQAVDYIFFGKPVKKMSTCCEGLVQEYITTKGALMSLMIEMYNLIEHNPDPLLEKVDIVDLQKSAKYSAKIARENSQKLVQTEKGRADVKAQLAQSISENSELNIEEEVKDQIRKKAFSLALDNLLVARSITESFRADKLNEWEGQIVEDAYKALREQLVESALFIIEGNLIFEDEELEEKMKLKGREGATHYGLSNDDMGKVGGDPVPPLKLGKNDTRSKPMKDSTRNFKLAPSPKSPKPDKPIESKRAIVNKYFQ